MSTRPSIQPAACKSLATYSAHPEVSEDKARTQLWNSTCKKGTPSIERDALRDAVIQEFFNGLGQLDALKDVCKSRHNPLVTTGRS